MMRKSNLTLALLLSLAAGAKAYGAIGAEIPLANTDIGNQASVSYFTEGNVQKFLQSNIVITRINSIYNLSLTPDRNTRLTKGKTAIFNHTLVNTGNILDNYDLTHTYGTRAVKLYLDRNNNGIIDNGETEIANTGSAAAPNYPIKNLEPGQAVSLLVVVPTLETDPDPELTGKLFAQSLGNTKLPKVEVNEIIGFQSGGTAQVFKSLNKSSGTSENDNEVTVYLKIANEDTKPEDIALNFSLTDILQPEFEYVPGSAKFKNFNGVDTTLTDDKDIEAVNNGTIVTFERTGQTINFAIETGVPANSKLNSPNGVLEFKVKVPANTPVGIIPNHVDYSYKPTGGIVVNTQSNRVNYEVLKYVRATFTGQHIPVGQAGETLRFENKFVNTANAPERYSLSLSDEFFPAGTTFRLAMDSEEMKDEAGNIYHEERPVIDTNGDGKIDTGIVYPGEKNHVNVILYATLPTNMSNPGSGYKIVKNATSTFKPDYIVKANDTLGTIRVSTVDITNDYSVNEKPDNAPGLGLGPERNPVTQLNLNPGKVGNFVLHVNNTSKYVEEQYSLEVSTKPDFSDMTLPSGVVVKFKQGGGAEITKTIKINPGNNQRIDAEVTVSPTAGAAVVPLYFRVISSTTGAYDIKYDSLSINPVRSVQVIPNLFGETYAGGNIVYTHKVRNNGNVLEGDGKASSLNLQTKESLAQWRTETFLDINKNGIFEPAVDIAFVDFATIGGLNPGQEVTIFARVFAPLGAPSGALNQTTITPNLTQGTYSTTPTVTSANDKTTVLAEKLTITKYQKIRGRAVDQVGGQWTTGLQNANSADIIEYRIDVRNSGTDEARTIQLKDSIPFYTTIIYGNGIDVPKYDVVDSKGAVTPGGVITRIPASGTRGEVVVDLDKIDAASTVRLYFSVKINGNPKPADSESNQN
ncbi:MAG: hypothetical protein ACRDAQ_11925 [Cetobacterium sp.]